VAVCERDVTSAAGGADHSAKLLDVKEGVVLATLSGHSKKVTALTFAGDSVIMTGSADKTVRAWRRDPDDASKWTAGYTYEAPAAVVQVHMLLNPVLMCLSMSSCCCSFQCLCALQGNCSEHDCWGRYLHTICMQAEVPCLVNMSWPYVCPHHL
jgi:WD40 repeat protein